MPIPVNVEEFEAVAREKMPAASYDYYAGAAEDEITMRDNREAFQRLRIAFRVLVDVAERDMRTNILGVPMSSPVILAPTAMHRMAHDEGERATARAAEGTETLMCLSSISSVAMEEVAACAPQGRRWFQLYHMGDKRKTESLVQRAQESGYEAIVVTVDTPVLGRRERDLRHPQVIPDGVTAVHFAPDPEARRAPDEERGIGNFITQPFLTWNDLAWLRSLTDLPLIPKGVVRADDAKRCIDEGMAGIWVSNHGGRQLDTSIATADALPSVAQAVGKQVPIIVDGGVRRGTDVVKALALGADAVAIGRPQLWGLAAGGEDGVRSVLTLLRNELSLAMALAGCKNLAEIDQSLLAM